MSIVKTGTLPKGIEIDGRVYRDYELHEQIVAHEVEVMESEDADRAAKSAPYFNVCIMARRIRMIGLDRSVTPAEIMVMSVGDFNHLSCADKEVAAQRATFREEGAGGAADGADAPQAGV
ncbi:hypothetical protein [Desulfobulbus elongatus]|uniref:hypothetical protein n=1 Tax=Desulfobulbus elongatus TaxID=53332 RepID=UPI000486B1D9|nr:hypothetical protein [Desulfobulbus elongatus]